MKHVGSIFSTLMPFFIIYTTVKVRQIFLWRWLTSVLATLGVFALMIGWQFLYRSHRLSQAVITGGSPFALLAWTGSILLGLWALWILYSLVYDILFVVAFIIRKILRSPPLDPRRRDIFLHLAPAGILGASGLMTAIGLGQAIIGPSVKEIDLEIPRLPKELNGLRIVQFSDLHVSPLIEKRYVENVVETILNLKPDLIVMTGDIADGTPSELTEFIAPLKKLKSNLGTYYVTGNHEYYWSVEKWLAAAVDLGFQPLINESKILHFNGADFLLGGVTDTSGGNFLESHESDPVKAMAGQKNLPFKLLLAHRPESCFEAEEAGWDVQLSGHTHAGQFFPFSLTMPFAHKYYKGLNRHKNMWLYINAGTGFWGPPQRFAIPSEVTLIKLAALS